MSGPFSGVCSRRRFLQLSGSCVALATLEACSPSTVTPSPSAATPSPSASPTSPADLTDPPFGLWAALRDAVRSSPDHLAREAARVVATKDPQAIFAFVRDAIATYPPDPRAFAKGAEFVKRWGSRGVLRGGAGTPRERADLLAELYTQAGLEAKVVSGRSSLTPAQVLSALVRAIERDFLPELDPAVLEGWRRQSGLAPSPSPDPVTPDVLVQAAERLSAPLLAQLPSDLGLPPDFDPTPDQMPFVEVTVGGQVMAADPFLPDARFGTSYIQGTATQPLDQGLGRVHLELAITTCTAPATPRIVLTGDWTIDQLVGRQVVLGFAPAGEIPSVLATPPRDIHVFTPTATVQALDVPAGFVKELMVAGTAITTGGETIALQPDGSVQLDGRPLVARPADPAAIRRIASLKLDVDASAFPTIALGVTPQDAGGNVVDGLDVTAFTVAEDGVERLAFLERGEILPPRVLMVFDSSSSIPAAFSAAARTQLGLDLTSRLQALHPGVEVAATQLEGQATWSADPAVIKGQLDSIGLVAGSDLWLAASVASRSGADAVIFVTDGQANDQPTPAFRTILAAGPPIVGLNVADATGQATLDLMAQLSHGISKAVSEASQAIEVAAAAVDAHATAAPRYRLRYRAVEHGPASRTVVVSLPSTTVRASGTYEAPAKPEAAVGPAIASLRLSLTVGDQQVTRVLAGYAGPDPEAVVTPDERDAAWAALFGTTMLSFEAAAPTASQLLDDVLTARLASKTYYDGAKAGDGKAMVTAYTVGFPGLPPPLLDLWAPLPNADGRTMTYELGLRVVLCAVGPVASGGARSRVDILPVTRFASVGPDAKSAFEATVRRSAYLAAIEGATFGVSTAGLLDGKPLRTVPPFAGLSGGPNLTDAQRALLDAAAQDRSYEPFVRFVWDGGTVPPPYWAIDPASGTLFGILPDGSGGGEGGAEFSNKDALELVEKWVALAQLGSELWIEGVPGLAMSWVIAVYLEAARAYILAGAAFRAEPGEGGPGGEPPKLPCNVGKSAVKFAIHEAFHKVGPLLVAESAADATGYNPLAC